MLSVDEVQRGLKDIEENYTRHLIEHFGEWKKWAEQSDRMYAGEEVKEEEVPQVFQIEMRVVKVIKEMEALGEFDWGNPTLKLLFAEMASGPFHRYFGGIIADIVLKLSKITAASSLIEIGAGDGRLTELLLARMREKKLSLPLLITDSKPVVETAALKLKEQYPEISLQSFVWDITKPPTGEMDKKITHPAILYERYGLTYTNYQAIDNLAQVGDILVLGGFFNNTSDIYGYDKIFAKIGVKNLLLSEVEKKLREHYPNIYVVDRKVTETIQFPNTTLLLAWR
jgi:hypothetical protein